MENTWDHMLRHCKQNLDEETKRGMFYRKLDGESPMMEYHLKQHHVVPAGEDVRAYRWLSDNTDRIIAQKRLTQHLGD